MKTQKEIIKEYLESAKENLIKLDIRMKFIQNECAKENKRQDMEELMQLTAQKKEIERWIQFLEGEK
ncbi:MAG: hypothetical protein WC246_03035 [Candidatus Paceibacterota bacterium]|jgi:hypothetical protein